MFRSAVAVLFTSCVLTGCQASVPAVDKAGEDGTAAHAVGSGNPTSSARQFSPASDTSTAIRSVSSTSTASAPTSAVAISSGSRPASIEGPAETATRSAAASNGAPPPTAQANESTADELAKAHAATATESVADVSPVADAAPRDAPPSPAFKLITVPAGTTLTVRLSNAVGSDTSDVEDSVRGKVATDVVVDGLTVIPAGSDISGSVIDAQRSGRVKGRASVAFRFDRIEVRDETSRIQTSTVAREAAADTRDDVKKGGIGAGIGAIVGGVAGGKKGAAIGAGVGGAGTVMATRGKEVHLAPGSRVRVTLRDALDVRVPLRRS